MKNSLIITVIASFMLISCKKHKEQNAWEAYEGLYYPVTNNDSYLLYQDSTEGFDISIREVSINFQGIVFSS